MEKEIRITLAEVMTDIKNNIETKYSLPIDHWSIQDREEFIKQVYYTYIREVKYDNKLYLDYLDSALTGNLASWFANTLSYEKKAPLRYRGDVIYYIEKLFKERYEVVE